MASKHPSTDAAIAEGLVLGGEFGPGQRALVELCRRAEIVLREIRDHAEINNVSHWREEIDRALTVAEA